MWFNCGLRIQFQPEFSVLVPVEHQHAPRGNLQPRAYILRWDRQLAPATVNQHGEADRSWSAVIEQFVHRPAYRAAGVEHIVYQHDVAAVDFERDLRRLYLWMQPGLVKIVAVERDIEQTQRQRDAERRVQPFGEPDPAGMDADQCGIGGDVRLELAHQPGAQDFRIGENQGHRNSFAK